MSVHDVRELPRANGRDDAADVARGYAIFGVVYVHGSYTFLPKEASPIVDGSIFFWAVPVFVILSAFFLALPAERSNGPRLSAALWLALTKRIPRLFIPFAIWSLLYFLVRRGWQTWPDLGKILTRDFAGYGWSGQYFFIILFQAALLVPIVSWRPTRLRVAIIAFILLAGVTLLLASINAPPALQKVADDRLVIFWIPHLLLGCAFAQLWRRRLVATIRGPLALLIVVAASVVLSQADVLYRWAGLRPWAPYQSPILIAFTPLIFIAVASLCVNASGPVRRVMRLVGRYSLGIFCLNVLIIQMLEGRTLPNISAPADVILNSFLPFIAVALIVLVCLLISILLNVCRLGVLVR